MAQKLVSSTDRVLKLLDLFSECEPVWTVDMMMEKLGTTRATTYRYVKSLNSAGLLSQGAGSSYVLGPRFVQLDRQIQRSDPLLSIVDRFLDDETRGVVGAKFVCGTYGDQVLSTYVRKIDPLVTLTMERGRTFPLFFAAPSKTILAYLPTYKLKNLYLYNTAAINAAGIGADWTEFKDTLKKIRKDGYCFGNQLDASVVGVAAPIFSAPNTVSSSLCFVQRKEISKDLDMERIKDFVVEMAHNISSEFGQDHADVSTRDPVFSPPRG